MSQYPSNPAVYSALQPFVEDETLAGAIAVVVDADGIVSLNSVGYADLETRREMAFDTAFWIASMTKPMTATALVMLVEEGKVALDEPIATYLPEFADQWITAYHDETSVLLRKPKRLPTVRDAMRHTSGLPFRSPMETPTLDLLPLRDAVLSYATTPLQYEPGAKSEYSNCGINVLARIVEVVSGVDYVTFMQSRLFDPLGMTETTFWPKGDLYNRIATLYGPGTDGVGFAVEKTHYLHYPLNDTKVRYAMPAGGLFSTASDVAKFCRMYVNRGTVDGRTYISDATITEMSTKQNTEEVPDAWGLAWWVGEHEYNHAGALGTKMSLYPSKQLATIWMVQSAGFPGNGSEAQQAFYNAVGV